MSKKFDEKGVLAQINAESTLQLSSLKFFRGNFGDFMMLNNTVNLKLASQIFS